MATFAKIMVLKEIKNKTLSICQQQHHTNIVLNIATRRTQRLSILTNTWQRKLVSDHLYVVVTLNMWQLFSCSFVNVASDLDLILIVYLKTVSTEDSSHEPNDTRDKLVLLSDRLKWNRLRNNGLKKSVPLRNTSFLFQTILL